MAQKPLPQYKPQEKVKTKLKHWPGTYTIKAVNYSNHNQRTYVYTFYEHPDMHLGEDFLKPANQ